MCCHSSQERSDRHNFMYTTNTTLAIYLKLTHGSMTSDMTARVANYYQPCLFGMKEGHCNVASRVWFSSSYPIAAGKALRHLRLGHPSYHMSQHQHCVDCQFSTLQCLASYGLTRRTRRQTWWLFFALHLFQPLVRRFLIGPCKSA